ncbi:class I tRNA ligase family protein [Geobacillus sp. Geo 8.1]
MDKEKRFSLFIPPPNITGDLHLGHALMIAIQDSLVRWKRLNGYEVQFYFGTDHAGISTEVVVKNHLLSQGIEESKLRAEEFVQHVWKWVNYYDERIRNQIKMLNVSCDWEKYLFTMTEEYSNAVLESFVRLYNKGYIYRGKYLVNICSGCQTSLSDLEVNIKLKEVKLHKVWFKTEQGEQLPVFFRNINDIRDANGIILKDGFSQVVAGGSLFNPITKEWLPVVIDKDLHILECGDLCEEPVYGVPLLIKKRKLHFKRYSALLTLDEKERDFRNLEEFVKQHPCYGGQLVSNIREEICSRCGNSVDVRMSTQWFFRLTKLAQKLKDILIKGEVEFFPRTAIQKAILYLENIEDWCISRQIRWGHRIPAWKCSNCKAYTVKLGNVRECQNCKSTSINQVNDVLDTWFSSAHWYLVNSGWPNDLKRLRRDYPCSLVETGHDILFFWVVRMMLISLAHTGVLPVKQVVLHGLILDENGQKMSKSKGNVVNVSELLDVFGSDVVRFGLLTRCNPGKDIRLDLDIFQQTKNTIKRLEQMINVFNFDEDIQFEQIQSCKQVEIHSDIMKWLLMQAKKLYRNISKAFSTYSFREVTSEINKLLNKASKWIVAWYKDATPSERHEYRIVMGILMTVLSPLLPDVCERHQEKLRVKLPLDSINEFLDIDEQNIVFNLDILEELHKTLLQLENKIGKNNAGQISIAIKSDNLNYEKLFKQYGKYMLDMTSFNLLISKTSDESHIIYPVLSTEVYFYLKIGKPEVVKNLTVFLLSEVRELNRQLKQVEKRLNNENFILHAPSEKVKEEKRKRICLSRKVEILLESVRSLSAI